MIEFDSLYSINGKKISEAIGRANQGVQSLTSDTISISELMDIVNEMHSDILLESVAEHYGNERRKTKLGESVKYSLPDESNVLDYINESEGEFYDVPPMRYYEIRQKQVKLQTYDELQKLCEKLKADKKLTHGKVLDKSSVTEQMNDLVRCLMTYSESYSLRGNPRRVKSELVKFAADKASIIFRAIKNGDYTTAMNTAYLAASDIVESLDFVDDANFYEYKELRDYLRTTRMVISEEDMSSIPDFTEFKRDQLAELE